MSDIIVLDERRPSDEPVVPHLQGPARCLACKHEWQDVSPMPNDGCHLRCPECDSDRGVRLTHVVQGGDHWQCLCGSIFFAITRQGTYCPGCGVWQKFTFKGGA